MYCMRGTYSHEPLERAGVWGARPPIVRRIELSSAFPETNMRGRIPKTVEAVEPPEVSDQERAHLIYARTYASVSFFRVPLCVSERGRRTAQDMTLHTQKAVAEMCVIVPPSVM